MENKILAYCKVCNHKFTFNSDWTYDGSECEHQTKDRIHVYDIKKNDVSKQNSEEKLCPCGHEHKPRSDGRGLRTYCVEGSQCNSDKCKEFVSLGADEEWK